MLYIPIRLIYCFHFVCVSLSALLIEWFLLFYLPAHLFTILHYPVCYLLPLAQHCLSGWFFRWVCEQYMNQELPDVQAEFRKGRGTRDQVVNICWIMEKVTVPEKYASLNRSKPLTVRITKNCGKFFKTWKYQTTLPASWEICMQVKKQQSGLDMGQQMVPNQDRSMSWLYIVTLLI